MSRKKWHLHTILAHLDKATEKMGQVSFVNLSQVKRKDISSEWH